MTDESKQSEATLPMLHRSQSGSAKSEQSDRQERIIRVHNLRHKRPHHYLRICESVQNSTKRAILAAIADKSVAEYKHIERYTDTSRRTIRKHITDLEDRNIVNKEVDAIMTVSFADGETALLVEDALAMFFASA